MITNDRAELFTALAELARRYPHWRVGQLVVNVAGWADADVWDAEDDQLLTAARAHLGLEAGRTPAAPPAGRAQSPPEDVRVADERVATDNWTHNGKVVDAFDNFAAFYQAVVQPRRAANPDHLRLDGRTTGGNWDVAGRFVHDGRVWTVHADSHYEPLALAYTAAEAGENPFVEAETDRGHRLDLAPHLRAARRSRHRHMYIYAWPTGNPS